MFSKLNLLDAIAHLEDTTTISTVPAPWLLLSWIIECLRLASVKVRLPNPLDLVLVVDLVVQAVLLVLLVPTTLFWLGVFRRYCLRLLNWDFSDFVVLKRTLSRVLRNFLFKAWNWLLLTLFIVLWLKGRWGLSNPIIFREAWFLLLLLRLFFRDLFFLILLQWGLVFWCVNLLMIFLKLELNLV